MTPTEWADLAFYRFSRFGLVPQLVNDDDWQQWAVDFCSIKAIRQQNPPDPYSFDNFDDWADVFNFSITIGD